MIRIVVITSALTIAVLSVAIAAVKGFAAAPAPCAASCIVADHTPAPAPAMGGMSGMPSMGGASSASMGSASGASMGGDMSMGPHMTLTASRPPQAGDRQRADAIVATLRLTLTKYADYRVAEADGYKPFLPNIPQPHYHFTNWVNGLAALGKFDPTRPTSLLYARDGSGYKLVGAMYTAPRNATPDQLNARIPLSIAHWHQHVNMCWGPTGTPASEYFGPNARFGLKGSIATQAACDSAGGRFQPVLFNWMVHVYPFETDQAKIWQVDMPGGMDSNHST
ncbi:MAG TPA: hypothetical protein VKT51_05780 [Candidatus Eremiobacteraceae bacterium]|nr:hypothetical protein [Candidatus Eremiobacteraceae bacterium]